MPGSGSGGGPGSAWNWNRNRTLTRTRQGKIVAGVCAGLGRTTGVDPILFRVILTVLVFFGGVGALLYLVAWIVLPVDDEPASPLESLLGRGRSGTSPALTVGLIVLAALVLVGSFSNGFPSTMLLAACLIGGMLLLRRAGGHGGGGGGYPPAPAGPIPPDPNLGFVPPMPPTGGWNPAGPGPGTPHTPSAPGAPTSPTTDAFHTPGAAPESATTGSATAGSATAGSATLGSPTPGSPTTGSPTTGSVPAHSAAAHSTAAHSAAAHSTATLGVDDHSAAAHGVVPPSVAQPGGAGHSPFAAAPAHAPGAPTAQYSAGPYAPGPYDAPGQPYTPPFAPYGPYAPVSGPALATQVPPYTPQPPYPPVGRRGKRPKERSVLGRLTLSVACLAMVVLLIVNASGVHVPFTGFVALALGIVAAGLFVGVWAGRARWLIPIGILLAVALGIGSIAENVDGYGGPNGGRDLTYVPTSMEQLNPSYQLGAGDFELDLSGLDFTGVSRTVEINTGFGDTNVRLPQDVDVTIEYEVGAGDTRVLSQRQQGMGVQNTVTDYGANGPDTSDLKLVVHHGAGDLEITR